MFPETLLAFACLLSNLSETGEKRVTVQSLSQCQVVVASDKSWSARFGGKNLCIVGFLWSLPFFLNYRFNYISLEYHRPKNKPNPRLREIK